MIHLLVTVAALSQPAYLPLPHELVQAAAADMQALPLEDQPHQQYFSFRDPDSDYRLPFNVTLNLAVNRGSLQLQATPVGSYLVRIDKRQWLPRQNNVERELRLTPPRENFDRILNSYVDETYTVDAADDQVDVIVTVGAVPLKSRDRVLVEIPAGHSIRVLGRQVLGGIKWLKTSHAGRVGFVRADQCRSSRGPVPVPALHITQDARASEAYQYMVTMTGVASPIVDAERWTVFSLRQTAGGLYYRLVGAEDGNRRLTQKEIERQYGVDAAASLDFRSTNGIGMWRATPTGSARRILVNTGIAVNPALGVGVNAVTEDRFKGDEQVDAHPIFNLLPDGGFVPQGKEALFTKPNGLWAAYLFNGKGELVDAAPGNLASDRTIPSPHVTELEPAISCIRCHAADDGWPAAPNSVAKLLARGKDGRRLSVVGDVTQLHDGRSAAEVLNEIASLYQGDASVALRAARDTFHMACKNMTRGPDGEGLGAKDACEAIGMAFNAYAYDPITPQAALRELGISVGDDATAVVYLNRLLPPLPDGREDPTITTIKRFDPNDLTFVISRQVWAQVYPATLHRALTTGTWGLSP